MLVITRWYINSSLAEKWPEFAEALDGDCLPTPNGKSPTDESGRCVVLVETPEENLEVEVGLFLSILQMHLTPTPGVDDFFFFFSGCVRVNFCELSLGFESSCRLRNTYICIYIYYTHYNSIYTIIYIPSHTFSRLNLVGGFLNIIFVCWSLKMEWWIELIFPDGVNPHDKQWWVATGYTQSPGESSVEDILYLTIEISMYTE